MRRFRWLIFALFALPWLASEAAAPVMATEDIAAGWRRTRDGWQRVETFCPPIPYRRPALHPVVVGALEILLTMTAMLALSNEESVKRRSKPQTSTVNRPHRSEKLQAEFCTKSSSRCH